MNKLNKITNYTSEIKIVEDQIRNHTQKIDALNKASKNNLCLNYGPYISSYCAIIQLGLKKSYLENKLMELQNAN